MTSRVDIHVHSRYSGDNDCDPEEMIIEAMERGLDGIVFTEHYSYEASEPVEPLRGKYGRSISIFRGVEYSSADGHCLVFGVNTDRLSMKNAPVEDLVRVVNEQGGAVIPSHPFRGGSGLGDMIRRIRGFCALEGYNGCNMHLFNTRAIDLARELNLPFTGGSDAHAPTEVGSCYTEFYDEITAGNFLDLLKSGNYTGIDTRKITRRWIP